MFASDPPQSVQPETLEAVQPELIVEIDRVSDPAALTIEANPDVRRGKESAQVHDRGCVEWVAIIRLCCRSSRDSEKDRAYFYCPHSRPLVALA